MRGKKGEPHRDPHDPPRRRANKRRGRGTYANDRPPIVGTVGRHVHQFTQVGAQLYTDENQSYNHVLRPRATVCHTAHEWARDADGDGVREVHVNSTEGLWTDVRNFLRPFKGVHKKYLAGYVAFAEFKRYLKAISPAFIASIVASHILLI